jgi:hypothetical protein
VSTSARSSQLGSGSSRIDLLQFSLRDPHANAVIVNALQREATVVVKKSLQEGFRLGVAVALWKRRPVVASDVGGHRTRFLPDRHMPAWMRLLAELGR